MTLVVQCARLCGRTFVCELGDLPVLTGWVCPICQDSDRAAFIHSLSTQPSLAPSLAKEQP